MRHRPRILPPTAFLLCCLVSCRAGPPGGLAFVDPVLEALTPGAAEAYRRAAGSAMLLPTENSILELHAALDRENPAWVLLSPVLASEIQGILAARPGIRVAYAGVTSPGDDARLYVSLFSPRDAAALAGGLLAQKAATMAADAEGGPWLTAAVFSGENAERDAEAFREGYAAASGPGQPMVKAEARGFSPQTAAELRLLDVRAAYVSARPGETERWLSESFADEAFIVAESPLPSAHPASGVDVLVAWDLPAALKSLAARLKAGAGGTESAPWRAIIVP